MGRMNVLFFSFVRAKIRFVKSHLNMRMQSSRRGVLETLCAFAPNVKQTIVIYGQPLTGKTHAVFQYQQHFNLNGSTYISATNINSKRDLMDVLKVGAKCFAESRLTIIDNVISADWCSDGALKQLSVAAGGKGPICVVTDVVPWKTSPNRVVCLPPPLPFDFPTVAENLLVMNDHTMTKTSMPAIRLAMMMHGSFMVPDLKPWTRSFSDIKPCDEELLVRIVDACVSHNYGWLQTLFVNNDLKIDALCNVPWEHSLRGVSLQSLHPISTPSLRRLQDASLIVCDSNSTELTIVYPARPYMMIKRMCGTAQWPAVLALIHARFAEAVKALP